MTWEQTSSNPFDTRDREIAPHPEHRAAAPAPAPAAPAPRGDNYQGGGQQNNQGYQGGQRQNNGGGGGYNNGGGGYQRQNNGGGGGYQRGGQGGGGGGYQRGGGNFQRPKPTEEELAAYQLYKTIAVTAERDAPEEVYGPLAQALKAAEDCGFVIRTSALSELEQGVSNNHKNVELVLPWKGFNELDSKFTYTPDEARELAKRAHPTWSALKPGPQTFCATKVRLVLGKDLKSPVQLLIIWTQDGAQSIRDCTPTTGLTRVAIDIAAQMRIPVFNLQRPDALQNIKAFFNVA